MGFFPMGVAGTVHSGFAIYFGCNHLLGDSADFKIEPAGALCSRRLVFSNLCSCEEFMQKGLSGYLLEQEHPSRFR